MASSPTIRPLSTLIPSLALALLALAIPSRLAAQSVSASGPEAATALEDSVEVNWTVSAPITATSRFNIKRDDVLIATVAPMPGATEYWYYDRTSAPVVTYEYCVSEVTSGGTETEIDCDDGGRIIKRPTNFTASDGLFETHVELKWQNQSGIRAGYNIYRSASNGLQFNGSTSYVSTSGVTQLSGSFTFEFWASRASINSNHFIVNVEANAQGDPQNVDVEIGFNSNNRFQVNFGTNVLATDDAYIDANWHHWAVVFDAPNRRRFIYRDGALIKTDVIAATLAPTGDLEFGRRARTQGPGNHGVFNGRLDEMRYWDRALAPDQVVAVMTGLLKRNAPGLVGYWPMDAQGGTTVADVVGNRVGTLTRTTQQGAIPTWVASGAPDRYARLGANDGNAYIDDTAVSGFQSYTYKVAAFQDVNGDGMFDPGVDFESEQRTDTGWRAVLTPPGNVVASDGQFNDRVRVTWEDLSTTESNYRIYRDAVLIATLPANSITYDDLTASGQHEYCVASASPGAESVRVCDTGRVGGLAAPANVAASVNEFDDKVRVTWQDVSNTESGFEIFRDGQLLATVAANATDYNDFSAMQHVEYDYCVRAFSTADPLNPSYSAQTCATVKGVRAIVLKPMAPEASTGHEDHVEFKWTNPSKTAMLFLVYRGQTLIEVLNAAPPYVTKDEVILSDTNVQYCVSAGTVVTPDVSASVQNTIAQVLQSIEYKDVLSLADGGEGTPAAAKLAAVQTALGVQELAGPGDHDPVGFVESEKACATGSRSLKAPTDVSATDDAFESRVEVTWTKNSAVAKGYRIYRQEAGGTLVRVDSIGPERDKISDFGGKPGVQYTYSVEAVDRYGKSKSNSDLGKRTLNAPTQLTVSKGTSETLIRLAWKDNSSAEKGYRIYRKAPSAAAFSLLDSTGVNEPAYVDSIKTVDLGREFEYSVRAFDQQGESQEITGKGHTTMLPPANVSASTAYTDKVAVVWVDRSNVEEKYEISIRERNAANGPWTKVELAKDSTLFIHTQAAAGKTYNYCVYGKITSGSTPVLSDSTCAEGSLFSSSVAGGGGNGGGDPTNVARRIVDEVDASSVDFGQSVAMSADRTVLVGVPGAGSTGAVRRFDVSDVNVWSGVTTFTPSPAAGEEFGHAVAIHGNYAVVGDPFQEQDNLGSFSVWKRASNVWSKIGTISRGPNSGVSVAVRDSFVVVGDDRFGTNPVRHGRVIVCNVEANPTCANAPQLDSLLTTLATDDKFGYSVGITREVDSLHVVVGAPGKNRLYFFQCKLNSPGKCTTKADWAKTGEFSNPFTPRNSSKFGAAVAIDNEFAVVGAPDAGSRGRIAVYERDGSEWNLHPLSNSPSKTKDFGASVAILGSRILVGAPGEEIVDRADAGAVYAYLWSSGLSDPTRYDARVAGTPTSGARFGASVALGPGFYLAGAPGDERGAVYSIPIGFAPPEEPINPPEVTLSAPTDVRASDGSVPDRIQVRWIDHAENETGQYIYRSEPGGVLDRLAKLPADVEFYDDFAAEPGEAYEYCVSAFSTSSEGTTETERACDVGWRPPNGTIAGRVAVGSGAGIEDVQVCLMPEVNRALLLDGIGGYVEIPIQKDADDNSPLFVQNNFTIEAWIRPHTVTGDRVIVSRDGAYTLSIKDRDLRFAVVEVGEVARTFDAELTLSPGTWYHVAVVRTELNNVKFFLNGVNVKEHTSNEPVAKDGRDSLTIGWSLANPTSFFNGEIDEVRIWNADRSARIAGSRFTALSGKEENLVGYWPLDEGLRRVVPDLTGSVNHGRLIDGIYLTDEGASLDVCARTEPDGNYSISRIRYGSGTEFDVIPKRPGREYSPSFKKITLSIDSPVQNEVFFSDVTAYAVAGAVQYVDVDPATGDILTCPVPDVTLHVGKANVAAQDNVRGSTGEDGSFALAVDPSAGATDPWYIIPKYRHPQNAQIEHTFDPVYRELVVLKDTFEVNFEDERRHKLTGHVVGGDPLTCHRDIGKAVLRIYTEDGCYARIDTVDSGENSGFFSINLPPQNYLVEVIDVVDGPEGEQGEDIREFFQQLGAVQVDLTQGDVERNLIYRAPLVLAIEGLDAPACPTGIVQKDETGAPIRTLPSVPTIGEFEGVTLTIKVSENYGDQSCPVEEGTVTIFDAIADRVDTDSTMTIENGEVEYTTIGASPNPFSGARIQGMDRSFQKPITVVAQVEGRPALMETKWAIVEGFRERPSTFVSATTEEFPLYILHDPPGSDSYAFLEKGTSVCTRLTNMGLFGGGVGFYADVVFGFKGDFGFSLGAHTATEAGAGVFLETRTLIGGDRGFATGSNHEICVTTTDTWATSSDPGWVGEDLFVGAALNFIFALADQVKSDPGACEVSLSEILATDLNAVNPFETAYVYGTSHIEMSLIPELERLIRLGGDATISGEVEGTDQSVRLRQAIQNWQKHLKTAENNTELGLAGNKKNRSFSGGTEFTHVSSDDTTRVTSFESSRFYIETDNNIGLLISVGYDQKIGGAFELHAETYYEKEETTGNSTTVGYVLADNDGGDFISVDVGKDPRYGTFVFRTISGRTSNPCEENTQCRDNPIILVDPPVRHNVDPNDAASFQLTLINASESNERRRYALMSPPETNPGNLSLTAAGGWLSSPIEFLLEPGKALTVNLDVFAGPSEFNYENVAVMLYPPDEWPIWAGEPRLPFAQSDSAFFSVHFNQQGNKVMAAMMQEGWNWFSINREGGDIATVLENVNVRHGDMLKSQRAESRYDSTAGWTGSLGRLVPGEGYRLRLNAPTVLRVHGEPIESLEPMELAQGWSWIGYMPTKRMPVEMALASLNNRVIEGDVVVGQHGFAQYVKGVGWVGTLREMMPGESYAIYLDGGGKLHYPSSDVEIGPREVSVREITVSGPDWKVAPAQYDATMTVVAEIQMDGVTLPQTTTKIALFDGETIRGTGEVHYVEGLGKHLTFILIYGTFDESKPLVAHVFDGERDLLYEDVAKVTFAAQSRVGQPVSPVVIELSNAGQAPELLDLPVEFSLHQNFPNPFNEYTNIGYDLPELADVRLVVYDMLGRRVVTLVDGEQPAGRHKVVFDGRTVASGMYVYRMQIGNSRYVGKMILVK